MGTQTAQKAGKIYFLYLLKKYIIKLITEKTLQIGKIKSNEKKSRYLK